MNCDQCKVELDESGFTRCFVPGCAHDRAAFDREVEQAKQIDLAVVAKIEKNEMPACFAPTRAGFVALASLLMEALRQNQAMAERLRALKAAGGGDLH